MGREREKKKNLVPNSVHTRPGQENSKKNRKKNIKKLKNPLSSIIFSQNEMRQAEKEKKKFQSRIPFKLSQEENCEKNRKKIKKPISGIFFYPKWDDIGREREK